VPPFISNGPLASRAKISDFHHRRHSGSLVPVMLFTHGQDQLAAPSLVSEVAVQLSAKVELTVRSAEAY